MSRVDLESDDWKRCCDIVDYLIGIGDSEILGDTIRMLCANSEEIMIIFLNNYGEDYDDYCRYD